MIKLPDCSTKNTVVEAELVERFTAGEVVKMVVYLVPDGKVLTQDGRLDKGFAFMAVHFTDEPLRPMFVATRRMRGMPKLFVDSRKMLSNVRRQFPGITVESVLPMVESAAPVDPTAPHAFFRLV